MLVGQERKEGFSSSLVGVEITQKMNDSGTQSLAFC